MSHRRTLSKITAYRVKKFENTIIYKNIRNSRKTIDTFFQQHILLWKIISTCVHIIEKINIQNRLQVKSDLRIPLSNNDLNILDLMSKKHHHPSRWTFLIKTICTRLFCILIQFYIIKIRTFSRANNAIKFVWSLLIRISIKHFARVLFTFVREPPVEKFGKHWSRVYFYKSNKIVNVITVIVRKTV